MSIDYNKFLKTDSTTKTPNIDYSKFGYTSTPSTPKVQGEIVTKTLSPDLGGGTYKMEVGNPNALIKTPRTDYGGLPTKEGYERADIFPVSLGGVNASSTNIAYEKFLPKGEQKPGQLTKTDKYLDEVILPKYKAGQMSLREAQVLATSYLRNEQTGLNKTMENQNLGGKFGELADKIVGFFQGIRKQGDEQLQQDLKNIAATEERIKKELAAKTEAEKGLTTAQKFQKTDPLFVSAAKTASEVLGKEIKPENYLTEYSKLSKVDKDLVDTKAQEKGIEGVAKVLTAPIRYTAGSLATAVTSYALEKADENKKYTPKTDSEKLIIGENDIQRLTKQEDLYGTIARGAGVPTALLAAAVIENPFLQGTGTSKLVRELIEKQIAKQGEKYLSKIGTKEIIRIADEAIKTEKLAGKITEQEAKKSLESINGFRVKTIEPAETIKPKIKPQEAAGEVLAPKTTKPSTEKMTPEEIFPTAKTESLIEEAKKYKNADEFVKNNFKADFDGKKPDLLISTNDKNIVMGNDVITKDNPLFSDMKKAISNGEKMPPIRIGIDNKGKYIIKDGNNRFLAYKELGIKEIPAYYNRDALTKIWDKSQSAKEKIKYPSILNFKDSKYITPIESNGKIVGGIDSVIDRFDPESLIVNYVRIIPEEQGKGLGTKAVNKLFNDNPGITQIKGHATAESRSFWNKVGAEFDGDSTAFTLSREKVEKPNLFITKEKPISTDKEFQSAVFDRMKAEHPEILPEDLKVTELNMKKDMEKAIDLVEKDAQKAYDIAMNKVESNDVLSANVNIVLAEQALRNGDNALYAKLIKNRSLAQTRRGQEIVAEKGSIKDNSTSRYVKELLNGRLDKLGSDYLKGLKDIVKKESPKIRANKKIASEVAKLEKNIKEKKLSTKIALELLDKLSCLT